MTHFNEGLNFLIGSVAFFLGIHFLRVSLKNFKKTRLEEKGVFDKTFWLRLIFFNVFLIGFSIFMFFI